MSGNVNVLDHVSDTNGAELNRLSKLYTFPDFVKQADVSQTLRPADLPVSVYADPVHKHYPCHNAASTWLSSLFFAEKKAEYHPRHAARVQQRLDGFGRYWGIQGHVEQLNQKWAETHKNADDHLPDADFAFVWVGDDGVKNRHLRIKNAMETKVAAEWLLKHRDSLTFTDRHTMAGKILEKAARYCASLGELQSFVDRQAGRGVCDPQKVAAMLRGRQKVAKRQAWGEKIAELASTVASKSRIALGPGMLVKLAETVDTFDRANNLVGRYSELIPRPEDVIFEATFREVSASANSACALTSGTIYDTKEFTKLSLDDLKAAFGAEFADGVQSGLSVDPEKVAELAQTLPRPDAELFDRLLAETGVKPISVKAASGSLSLDAATLAKMAGEY